jgi:aspartate kinase
MKEFNFGRDSIKNVDFLENVAKIIRNQEKLIVVISAIDKTTNALEELLKTYFLQTGDKYEIFEKIKKFHQNYIGIAFGQKSQNVTKQINIFFDELLEIISSVPKYNYDIEYDNVVSFGELFSTVIVSEYLKSKGIDNKFIDIRNIVVTDANHRDAKVLWDKSVDKAVSAFSGKENIFVTQGFIGRDCNNMCTTLGREGSDYTASALAYMLNAESVTVWKDVPGIMNADPVWCNFAKKIDILSFHEAIELAFYGAKIIHPKTIKPIENKNIPLYVKSFLNPEANGTEIKDLDYKLNLDPIYILKSNQILLSIQPKDFSFIVEENISRLFGLFAHNKIKVNVTQNSAVSFSASIDGDTRNFEALIAELQKDYFVKYNKNLELVTIRYYNNEAIEKMTKCRTILLEQKSRNTARFVLE